MTDGARSLWRFMPLGVAASLFVVAVVNGVMIYDAVSTFPGEAAGNAFEISNHYDRVLELTAQEQALGWSIELGMLDGHPVARVDGRDGTPVPGLRVTGEATRPVGGRERVALTFVRDEDGSYLANETLPGAGQWDVALGAGPAAEAKARMHVTRRVVAR